MAETTTTAAEPTVEEKKKPTLKESFQAYSDQNTGNIGKVYDKGLAAQKQSLLDAYNANTGAQQEARQTVRQTYGTLNNDLAVQNARNTANINQFADVRDVNRQPGSQAALQLNNARAVAMGNMAYRQQQALAENQRQQDLAKAQYQSRVQAAIADKDYKQAAALLDSYNNENAWRDQQAAILASYGNFDSYKEMYGDEAGEAMQKVWQAQNPDVAYRTGAITPQQYRQITGKWPKGYTPPSAGGYVGYGYIPGGPGDGGSGKGGFEIGGNGGGGKNGYVSMPVLTPTAINAAERY